MSYVLAMYIHSLDIFDTISVSVSFHKVTRLLWASETTVSNRCNTFDDYFLKVMKMLMFEVFLHFIYEVPFMIVFVFLSTSLVHLWFQFLSLSLS